MCVAGHSDGTYLAQAAVLAAEATGVGDDTDGEVDAGFAAKEDAAVAGTAAAGAGADDGIDPELDAQDRARKNPWCAAIDSGVRPGQDLLLAILLHLAAMLPMFPGPKQPGPQGQPTSHRNTRYHRRRLLRAALDLLLSLAQAMAPSTTDCDGKPYTLARLLGEIRFWDMGGLPPREQLQMVGARLRNLLRREGAKAALAESTRGVRFQWG